MGIAGGTGSGKTTFTTTLINRFKDDITVIHHDNYYNILDHLTFEERCLVNYDHPDSFDTKLMIEDIKKLKNGETIQEPVYDYVVHNRSKDKTITLKPSKILIIEGILILQNKELRDLMDMKVFVDTDADVRILRRIMRDVKERGRTLDSVVNQYLTTVKPMHEQFVEPSKRKADLIVPEGGENLVALELLIKWVENHLHSGTRNETERSPRSRSR